MKYTMLIVISLLVPVLLYSMGAFYSASFNLAEWQQNARMNTVFAWGVMQVMAIIFLHKY